MIRKLIILHCIAILVRLPARALDGEPARTKELKSKLSSLYGQEKADCLNKIAWFYIQSATVWADSGLLYAHQAYVLSEQLNYTAGLAYASSQYAKGLLQITRPDEGLKYYQLTTQLAHKLGNDSLEAIGIRGAGQALWYQGNFQEAIDTISAAIEYFKRLHDDEQISDAILTIASIYGNVGNYEKAFEVAQQALRISMLLKDKANTILSLIELANLYRNIGDYPTAFEYLQKGYAYHPKPGPWYYRYLSMSKADLYCDLGKYDSAWYFYQQSFIGNPASQSTKLRLGNYYFLLGNYDEALNYFTQLYFELKKGGEHHIYMYAILGMAKVYLMKKDFANALHYGKMALSISEEKKAKLNIRDSYQVLSSIYEALKNPDQAFRYYRLYVNSKDSIITDQFKGKLYEFKRVSDYEKGLSQIKLLKSESQVIEQKLKGNRLLRNLLLAVILFIAGISLVVFWSISLKRKNEKLRNERIQSVLQKKASDLEMQALRAQMNPHFIFNCLSSINSFILKNQPDNASDYLTRFSRLIRMVLMNSQKQLIVLEEEIAMLKLYLEMEQLRFKDSFDYTIMYSNDIKMNNILIPPLLLQPFCENAIWHGLMHKNGYGKLTVEFSREHNILHCSITDNGVGRAKAEEIKSKSGEEHKSFGLRLTVERLALFNENKDVQTSYKIEDITDAKGACTGTKVTLNISYKEFE